MAKWPEENVETLTGPIFSNENNLSHIISELEYHKLLRFRDQCSKIFHFKKSSVEPLFDQICELNSWSHKEDYLTNQKILPIIESVVTNTDYFNQIDSNFQHAFLLSGPDDQSSFLFDLYLDYIFDKFLSLEQFGLSFMALSSSLLSSKIRTLVDVGSSTGNWLSYFYSNNMNVVGIESSSLGLSITRNKLNYFKRMPGLSNNYEIIQKEFSKYPLHDLLKDHKIDCYILNQTLNRLPDFVSPQSNFTDQRKLLTDIHTLLKDNGYIIILNDLYEHFTHISHLIKKIEFIARQAVGQIKRITELDLILFSYFTFKQWQESSSSVLKQDELFNLIEDCQFIPITPIYQAPIIQQQLIILQKK